MLFKKATKIATADARPAYSKEHVARHVSNTPRLRVAFDKFSELAPEAGVSNPEERKLILYTSSKEIMDGVRHYAEMGVKFRHVCVFRDGAPPVDAIVPPLLREHELAFYPDHEIVVYRNIDTMFAEAGLCYRLSTIGINYVTRSNFNVQQRTSPIFHYPNILRTKIDDLTKLYNMMLNDQSRSDLAAYIKGRCLPSLGYHRIADFKEYYHPICQAAPGDVVIDAGLFDGMTTFEFGNAVGPAGHVYGFEPSPHMWKRIEDLFATDKKRPITLVKEGVWDKTEELKFIDTRIVGNSQTKLSAANEKKATSVRVGTIDDFCKTKNLPKVDFIKMDIEGAEMNALNGSIETIRKHRPKLAICVYHKLDDIFDIPFFIDRLGCGYRFYFGAHSIGATSIVLYAVPDKV